MGGLIFAMDFRKVKKEKNGREEGIIWPNNNNNNNLFNCNQSYGAFTLDVKSIQNENLGGILGGTQLLNGCDSLNIKWMLV